eukprot:gene42693-52963_t
MERVGKDGVITIQKDGKTMVDELEVVGGKRPSPTRGEQLGGGIKDPMSIRNNIITITTACFELAMDYCIVKMPGWDLNKFHRACNKLGSSMCCVDKVMAVGKTFEEAMQKAVRMVSGGVADGLDGDE